MKPARIVLEIGALLIAGGCSSGAQVRPAAEHAAPTSRDDDLILPLHENMQEHFVRTDLMLKALIAGDLDRVRAEAKWLVERPEPDGMPVDWTPFILDMNRAAIDVADTRDPEVMAMGVARMGAACGQCHASLGVRLNLTWSELPRATVDPKAHMRRHLWGVERFWDGLVSADHEAWRAGAQALIQDPLYSDQLTPGEVIDPHIQQFADDVLGLGRDALGASDFEQRAALFGDVVATCARCHYEVRKGPRSPPRLD